MRRDETRRDERIRHAPPPHTRARARDGGAPFPNGIRDDGGGLLLLGRRGRGCRRRFGRRGLASGPLFGRALLGLLLLLRALLLLLRSLLLLLRLLRGFALLLLLDLLFSRRRGAVGAAVAGAAIVARGMPNAFRPVVAPRSPTGVVFIARAVQPHPPLAHGAATNQP